MPLLDSIIHKHLDVLDEAKAEIEKDIDELIVSIDIDAIIDDPQGVMEYAAELLQQIFIEKYSQTAIQAGLKLAKDIQEADNIEVPKSKDPKLNQEILA